MSANPSPPIAARIPTQLVAHGDVRVDDYFWLRDRDNPEVLEYLEAENQYTAATLAHTDDFQSALFDEIVGRIKQDDQSVPYKLDDFYYLARFEPGREYPIYSRKRGSLEGEEEIMLDVNQLAEGHEFYSVAERRVSSGQDILSFAVDSVGRRIYEIHFKNLSTGEMLPDVLRGVTGNMAWANDNQTLFYSKQDPETLRSHRIYRHLLGIDSSADVLVYEEEDETFSTYVWKTKSKRFMFVASVQTVSSEYRYLDAGDPTGTFTVITPRQRNHEYDVDHMGDAFYIRTNLEAENFRLMRAPMGPSRPDAWREVVPHRADVFLEKFELFRAFLVLGEREDGLVHIRIMPWSGEGDHYLEFQEPAYLASVDVNPELDTTVLRYGYTSMTTPNSVFDYDMATRERTLMKEEEVVGDFDKGNYVTERHHASAPDGTLIPISLVYRKDMRRTGGGPLVLYGYGSYGISMDPTFSSARLSLLDRGVAFAVAHIRGGQVRGREWYESGKLLHKMNTFTDFIACAEHFVREGVTTPEQLFAMGGSAGGLLMGVVMNLRPDLFHGIVAQVPFVDIVTTMLDDTLPLTTGEYDEWGDPNDERFYRYMLSYSPYDNIEPKDYPHLLVLTGFHDSQVHYWEPAKWVAKLRALKTNGTRLLLKTNLDAGHRGASGRFRRFRETALAYAFILDLAGAAPASPLLIADY